MSTPILATLKLPRQCPEVVVLAPRVERTRFVKGRKESGRFGTREVVSGVEKGSGQRVNNREGEHISVRGCEIFIGGDPR